jgi:hypothetical protein
MTLNIALTCHKLLFPDNPSILVNGHNLNVILWYHFFENCGYNVSFISNENTTGVISNNGHNYNIVNIDDYIEDETKILAANTDYVFIVGSTDKTLNTFLNKKSTPIIYLMMGNVYINDLDCIIYKIHDVGPPVDRNNYNQIWVSPHFEYSIDYYKIRYGIEDICVGPYIWGDDVVKNKKTMVYTKGEKLIVAICEPNISCIKNCMIPLCICEKGEQYIEFVRCYCTNTLRENKFFINFVKNTNIHKNKKAVFNDRELIYEILQKCNCVVSTTQECDLNYLFLECFYFGIPLIHNSKMLQEYGYYYPDLDISKGVEQIEKVFKTHDTELYKEKHKPLLYNYSIYNRYYQKWVKTKLIKEKKVERSHISSGVPLLSGTTTSGTTTSITTTSGITSVGEQCIKLTIEDETECAEETMISSVYSLDESLKQVMQTYNINNINNINNEIIHCSNDIVKPLHLDDLETPLVISYCNKYKTENFENTKRFVNTLENNNWKYKIIGDGEIWKGFLNRMISYKEVLKTLHPNKIVVISDAHDVYCTRNSANFIQEFSKYNRKIIVSMEMFAEGFTTYFKEKEPYFQVTWLGEYFKYHNIDPNTIYRKFVNGGLIIGYAEELYKLYDWCISNNYTDDQKALGAYMNAFPSIVYADVNKQILHTTSSFVNMGLQDKHQMECDSPTIAELIGRDSFFLHIPGPNISEGQKFLYNNIYTSIQTFNNTEACKVYPNYDMINFKKYLKSI